MISPRCLTCHSGSSVVYLSWNTISMGGVATPPAMALLYMFCLVERRKRVSDQADASMALYLHTIRGETNDIYDVLIT